MTLESNVVVDADRGARALPRPLRLNNIAELRLLFAACVVLSHAVQLAGATEFDLIRFVMNSEVAVQGFFILSGYLVFGSYDRLRDTRSFYRRRFLRIYPAYIVAVLLFLLLGIAQALAFGRSVAWDELAPYLAANLSTLNFLHPTVGGVFAGNSVPHLNGALWSIKVELMFYVLVPPLYWLSMRVPIGFLSVLLIVAGVLWWPVLTRLGEQLGIAVPLSFKYQVPGQLHFFALGIALFARTKERITTAGLASIIAVTLLLLLLTGAPREAMHALGLVVVIGTVAALPQVPGLIGHNDISYGIYLSHFPTIQLLLAAGAGTWPFPIYIGAVVIAAAVYGFLSWKLIERPMLGRGSRRRE